jgi:hypothetical protein
VAHEDKTDRASIAIRIHAQAVRPDWSGHSTAMGTRRAQWGNVASYVGRIRQNDRNRFDRRAECARLSSAPQVDNNGHGRAMYAARFMKGLSLRGAR